MALRIRAIGFANLVRIDFWVAGQGA